MNKSTKQALFDKAVEKDLAYRGAKVREMEIARAQAAARIQTVLNDRNVFFASLVDDQGFKAADIARALNTTNWKTAKDAIDAGRAVRAVEHVELVAAEGEQFERYHWDAEGAILTVTYRADEFTQYADMLARTPAADGEQWEFYLEKGALRPVRDDEDETWENPVVQVVMTTSGKRDALAYINERQE